MSNTNTCIEYWEKQVHVHVLMKYKYTVLLKKNRSQVYINTVIEGCKYMYWGTQYRPWLLRILSIKWYKYWGTQ